jgi:hypothetical protein
MYTFRKWQHWELGFRRIQYSHRTAKKQKSYIYILENSPLLGNDYVNNARS